MELALLGVLVVLGVPVAAIAGLIIAKSARSELRLITARVQTLESEVRTLRGMLGTTPVSPPPQAEAAAPQRSPAQEQELAAPEQPPEAPSSSVPPVAQPTQSAKLAGFSLGDLERQLSERWMVWLGGVALALGGAFLVKFSIDQGLLGPAVRVSLGCLLGVGIMALGHWISFRRGAMPVSGVDPSYVPPALVGAGATIVFASLFAAYALYDLLPPLMAFAGLALVAAAAALMSLRHGPFVAALGLVGALVVPALVRSDQPSAFGLFAYLLLIGAPMMALLRWRGWLWLAWIELGGALLWVMIWLAGPFKLGDEWIVSAYLLLTFAIFVALRRGVAGVSILEGIVDTPVVRTVVTVATAAVALGLITVAYAADNATISLVFILMFSVACLAFGYRDQAFDFVPMIAACAVLIVHAIWDLPVTHFDQADIFRPAIPEGAGVYSAWAASFAAMFGIAAFVLCQRSERPIRWAVLSGATPGLMMAIVYWRLSSIGVDLAWATAALVLAALLLAAAQQVARLRHQPGMEGALGVYAVAVIAALALAATMALMEAWLTVALSLTLPAVAWVNARLHVAGLRQTALVVAAVVLVRLTLNPYVLDYPIADQDAFNWLLYGYGLPAAAFAAAAYLFRPVQDLTVQTLQAGAILFTVLLISFEIHHVMAGGLSVASYSLAEQSLQTLSWLFVAAGLFAMPGWRQHDVVQWAGRILLTIAAAQAIMLQALIDNPFFTGEPVGESSIFNLLLFAYGLPAALFGLHVYLAPNGSRRRQGCAILTLVLGLLWLTLEVRHSFVGSELDQGDVTAAELYSYSLAWMLVSALVLALGIRFISPAMRRCGLALLIIVVLKVFLIDMAHLDGIWRAFSFLGLGAALVAVGWLYRRFVGNPGLEARG